MSEVVAQYRTVTCDAPSCKNTVTFEQRENNQRGYLELLEKHAWLRTVRQVQAAGTQFIYCSDTCELESVGLGKHNASEPKTVVLPEGANAVAHAAAQAKAIEDGTRALKSGTGIRVVQS